MILAGLLLAANVSAAPVEVSASSGPVKLTFTVLETALQAKRRPWFKFKVENIGTRAIEFDDEIFRTGSSYMNWPELGIAVTTKGYKDLWSGMRAPRDPLPKKPYKVKLKPGESISSAEWCLDPLAAKAHCKPLKGYIEGQGFDFSDPGEYPVRGEFRNVVFYSDESDDVLNFATPPVTLKFKK